MTKDDLFIEVESYQQTKQGQLTCGDAVFTQKINEDRVVTVLSDGLGSGVKANVLASMTTRMALKFVASDMDILRSAEIMMGALPVCQVRKISYATFTIVDCRSKGYTKIIEMDNPSTIMMRGNNILPLNYKEIVSNKWQNRIIRVAEITTNPDDRLVFFSDGVTQSGLGTALYPLGWGAEGSKDFIFKTVRKTPNISARQLAKDVVEEALKHEIDENAGDDISCTVVYFRQPRNTIVLSGPPYDNKKDKEFALSLYNFDGKKVICGGTTADIVANELGLKSSVNTKELSSNIPATSEMEDVDLVTEGIITLSETAKILENKQFYGKKNPAKQLANILIDSDHIEFVVGTRINEAHQDPTLPINIEIRRNIINKIGEILINKYRKKILIKYI